MAWYDIGTVSVTNGSTTVTGSGTNFIAGAQIGEAFYGPDDRLYEIQAIVSATSLTLSDSYLGSNQTGQSYYIIPTQSLVASLASQVSTLISDFQTVADEAGEGKFNNGTAALPGITFNLDQDTGFSRPAANQIGFSTAGVQRALLSSTALTLNVPVSGTTGQFGTSLNVDGTVTADGLDVGNDGQIYFASTAARIEGTSSGADNINIYANNNIVAKFQAGGDISFFEDTGTTPKFFWDSSAERLGIGTTAPTSPLTVVNLTGGFTATFKNSVGSGTQSGLLIDAGSTSADFAMYVRNAAASSDLFAIKGNGNVGIGTSNPTAVLDVRGSAFVIGAAGTRTTDTANGNGFEVVPGPTNNLLSFNRSTSAYLPVRYRAGVQSWEVDNVERMRITSTGNVGIGTSSPAGCLHIARADPFNLPFRIENTSGANSFDIRVGLGATLLETNGAQALGFATNNTERARIDSAGNVGIGTSSPAGKLHVQVSSTGISANSNFRNLVLEESGNVGLTLLSSNTALGSLVFGDSDNATVGRVQYSHDIDAMSFFINAAERARIDASGHLLVGATSLLTAGDLGVEIDGPAAVIRTGKDSTDARTCVAFNNPNGQVGSITTTGSATAYNTSSDYRLKEDVQPMSGASDRVLSLKPCNFAWKADGTRVDGFLAHEVQAFVPEAVTGEKDGEEMQAIDQSKLVPLLTAALQEALQKIDALEARITALEA